MAYEVTPVPLHETTRERYLNYAMSVITSRALPDVRDGLKPVQRRILYGMEQLKLRPDSRYRKSAQVVGEVMGKYHPHGDSAIYEAMVRMAQTFSLRYTLVDGQGNFGSLDGDGAAAMRYTEARMAPLALGLLRDISDEIVPYKPTYDGSDQEPAVLPADFPNLLVNGATGIAVGMATNIPPHNLREVLKACVAMIDNPSIDLDGLMKSVKAPDFPTAGRILNDKAQLRKIYETGRGPVELRGEYTTEKEGRRERVIITSVPYTANKASIVEKIADHIRSGRLPLAVDVRDESTEEIRIAVDLKSKADPEAVMAYLYKHTPLQTRFHVNLTALIPSEADQDRLQPKQLGLKEMIRHFLDFRMQVYTRRLQKKLREIEARIHILEGLETIFDALDEAIALIRASKDRAEARDNLMERFELDDLQANHILDTRLHRLTQMSIDAIRSDLESNRSEAETHRSWLADEGIRWQHIKENLQRFQKDYGDPRRTKLGGVDLTEEFDREDYIVDEDVFVMVTRDGWIKRQGSYTNVSTIRVRDGDEVGWTMLSSTTESAILFTNRGRAYTTLVDDIPSTTGYGEPVQAIFDFDDGEQIVGMAVTDRRSLPELYESLDVQSSLPFDPDSDLSSEAEEEEGEGEPPGLDGYHVVAISRQGQSIRIGLDNFEAPSTRNGRMFMRLQSDDLDEDCVINAEVSGGGELVSLCSRDSRALTFPVEEISILKSAGKGVRAISLDKKDRVLGFTLTREDRDGLLVETNRGRTVTISPRRYAPVSRASRGRLIVRRGHIAEVHMPVVEVRPEEEEEEASASDDTAETGSAAPESSDDPSPDDDRGTDDDDNNEDDRE